MMDIHVGMRKPLGPLPGLIDSDGGQAIVGAFVYVNVLDSDQLCAADQCRCPFAEAYAIQVEALRPLLMSAVVSIVTEAGVAIKEGGAMSFPAASSR